MPDPESMANPTRLHIAYDGPALETHRMDVKDLAPALLAFSEMVERANELLNQDRAQVRVQVRGSFRSGSFGIDIEVLQSLHQWLVNFGRDPAVQGTLTLIEVLGIGWAGHRGALWLIRKLRGRQIETFSLRPDGKFDVVIDNEMVVVEEEVLRLVRDHKIRRCFEQLITRPLGQEGIDTFDVVDPEKQQVLVHVDRNEAPWFAAPPLEASDETTNEFDARLQIVGLSFVEGNKWRFTDGQNAFYAAIVDPEFVERIELRQENFSKGDTLHVRLRQRQSMLSDGKLRSEYEIVKVHQHFHQEPVQQQGLSFPPAEDE